MMNLAEPSAGNGGPDRGRLWQRWQRWLLWQGPLLLGMALLLWSGLEAARYEASWRWLQWWLRLLCPEHAPTDPEQLQVQVTMYQLNGAARRLAHILGYALLTALSVRAIQRGRTRLRPASLGVAALLGVLYTLLDTLNRALQPARHVKWTDFMLNLVGVCLTLTGTWLYFAVKSWERRLSDPEGEEETVTELERLLAQVDTASLQEGDLPTRALVVLNETEQAAKGRVRFAAAFPIRASVGPRPVVVRNSEGEIVPSRLTRSEVTSSESLPADRVLWTLELEFIAAVPPRSGRAYGSVFAESPRSRSEDGAFWDALPLLPLTVAETECHPGSLPPLFPLPESFPLPPAAGAGLSEGETEAKAGEGGREA